MSDTTNNDPPPLPQPTPPPIAQPPSFVQSTQAIRAEAQAAEADALATPRAPIDGPAWFARRFPVGHPRNAMGPVHWKGWAAMFLYVAATIGGALAFVVMAIGGLFVTGVILFVVIAFGALLALLIVSALKGDETNTIEDYAIAKQSGDKLSA
jgi:hypothetical protein